MPDYDHFHPIKLLVLDVDGVLPDGRTWQDAPAKLRRAAVYITMRQGGDGAVLEGCNHLIGSTWTPNMRRRTIAG